MKFTVEEMLAKLPLPANEKWTEGVFDLEPFEKAGVRLVFFAPRGVDHQTVHDRDEFYFIVSGTGTILINDEAFDFAVGDVFFVEKNVQHRFENFTDDLVTWAIFF
jgi:mannose-6-phosphate isomerase-like protein (cupin superfamily)